VGTIFAYDWKPQERLLLSILATTGMRPSEAGNMTWERFNDTEHKGIRFFTTLDTETEQVRIKNKPSKRQVPLHPDLVLPEKSTGRLFNYSKDEDGRCSTSIAHIINPTLQKLVPHPYKSVRSFRRTFKNMMSDLGVREEVHDAITGHGENKTASRKHYGGGGFVQRFEAISKLDISFLDPA
jgi:integrase